MGSERGREVRAMGQERFETPAPVVLSRVVDRFAVLRPGAPLDADAPVPASPPTLVVDYTTDYSRGATASAKPPTVFAGIIFVFDAAFVLPPGAPLKASLHSWRGPELWRIKGAADMERTDFQQKVYDAMIDGAFEQLGKKLADVFF